MTTSDTYPGIALVEEAEALLRDAGRKVARGHAIERVQQCRDVGCTEGVKLWMYVLQLRTGGRR